MTTLKEHTGCSLQEHLDLYQKYLDGEVSYLDMNYAGERMKNMKKNNGLYKTMKVFDYTKMSEDVKKTFVDMYDYLPNGSYISFYLYEEEYKGSIDELDNFEKPNIIINNWLFQNGVTSEDTCVLISFCW